MKNPDIMVYLAGILLSGLISGLLWLSLIWFRTRNRLFQERADAQSLSVKLNERLSWKDEQILELRGEGLKKDRMLAEREGEIHNLLSAQGDLKSHITELETRLKVKERELEDRLKTYEAHFEKRQQQFRDHFENLGRKIFDENAATFRVESEKNIGTLILPFRDRLQEFQNSVERFYGDEAKERASLRNEIGRIVLVNEQVTRETKNLTSALKGDSKIQGNWGEFVLENILTSSGLREGEEYTVQGKNMGLTDDEGHRLRPDVVVHLPEGKHIVIDSKVSLTHYEHYTSVSDEAEKERALQLFLESVKRHVSDLSGKKYHHLDRLFTPDFVLMFMPLEGAFSLAMQKERGLHDQAWHKQIVIVSPTTLFVTLRTVASIWKREQQNRNALEIAKQAGGLYDKFAGLVQDLENVKKGFRNTEESFQNVMNKLHVGKGNLLSRVENIRKLGAKTSKQIASQYLWEEAEEEDSLEKLEAGELTENIGNE